jgi:hypothetical protein
MTMRKSTVTSRSTRKTSARKSKSPRKEENYPGLDFGRDELSAVMRKTYDEIIGFITTPAFKNFHAELTSLPPKDRPAFVASVILQPEERANRGIVVPDGILIQTSAFGDRRPTLFAVKKFLPLKYHGAWENVNWTFGNEYEGKKVSRAPKHTWRPPLPVALQNAVIAANADLESVPPDRGVNFGMFARADLQGSRNQTTTASRGRTKPGR